MPYHCFGLLMKKSNGAKNISARFPAGARANAPITQPVEFRVTSKGNLSTMLFITLLLFLFALHLDAAPTLMTLNAQTEILDPSNVFRDQYCLRRLTWDPQLAQVARDWAMACRAVHSTPPRAENAYASYLTAAGRTVPSGSYPNANYVGENLAYVWGQLATNQGWTDEQQFWTCGQPYSACVAGEQCGHFTQIVWNHTSAVGCARVQCDNTVGTCMPFF